MPFRDAGEAMQTGARVCVLAKKGQFVVTDRMPVS